MRRFFIAIVLALSTRHNASRSQSSSIASAKITIVPSEAMSASFEELEEVEKHSLSTIRQGERTSQNFRVFFVLSDKKSDTLQIIYP